MSIEVDYVVVGPIRSVPSVIADQVRHSRKVFVWNETLGRYVRAYKNDLLCTLATTYSSDSPSLIEWRTEDNGLLFIG